MNDFRRMKRSVEGRAIGVRHDRSRDAARNPRGAARLGRSVDEHPPRSDHAPPPSSRASPNLSAGKRKSLGEIRWLSIVCLTTVTSSRPIRLRELRTMSVYNFVNGSL